MRRWYDALEIKSDRIEDIKNCLLDTYDFEENFEDFDIDEIFSIEDDMLIFEGDDGLLFTYKNSSEVPSVDDIFNMIIKRIEGVEVEAFVSIANSIDETTEEYTIICRANELFINGEQIQKCNDSICTEDGPYINTSMFEYFVNQIKVYDLLDMFKYYRLDGDDRSYFLEIYYDNYELSFSKLTLFDNSDEFERVIQIEETFDYSENFTYEMASLMFHRLDEELQKRDISISEVKAATDEEYEEFAWSLL